MGVLRLQLAQALHLVCLHAAVYLYAAIASAPAIEACSERPWRLRMSLMATPLASASCRMASILSFGESRLLHVAGT